MTSKNELTVNAISELETLVSEASEINKLTSMFQKTFKIAVVAQKIGEFITPQIVQKYLMPLQGSRIGFKTDKDDKGGYSWQIVQSVAKEAFLLGLPMAGNCVNIISNNLYATKEGFEYLLNELNMGCLIDIEDIVIETQAYYDNVHKKAVRGRARATAKVSFMDTEGERVEKSKSFTCKINNGMDEDAIEGKITRKAGKWLYNFITKTNIPSADDVSAEAKFNNAEQGSATVVDDIKPDVKPDVNGQDTRQRADSRVNNSTNLFNA